MVSSELAQGPSIRRQTAPGTGGTSRVPCRDLFEECCCGSSSQRHEPPANTSIVLGRPLVARCALRLARGLASHTRSSQTPGRSRLRPSTPGNRRSPLGYVEPYKDRVGSVGGAHGLGWSALFLMDRTGRAPYAREDRRPYEITRPEVSTLVGSRPISNPLSPPSRTLRRPARLRLASLLKDPG